MQNGYCGELVKLYFNSADASTAAAISLYDAQSTARTLASDERLILCNVWITRAGTITFDLFDDADGDGNVDAGETLVSCALVGSAIAHPCFDFAGEGMPCGRGRLPKIKASAAGQINLSGTGYIVKT